MPYLDDAARARLSGLLGRLQDASFTHVASLHVEAWITPEPVPYEERRAGTHRVLKVSDRWGNLWDCGWFQFTGQVPESAAGHEVVLLIDVNGEALVVDKNGDPALGLTTVNSEFDYSLGRPGKRVVPFFDSARGGETIDLWADTACNDLFGRLQGGGTLREAGIAVVNREMRALAYDWEVLHELMRQLPEHSARRARIFAALTNASRVLRRFSEEEAAAARAILAPELAKAGGDPSLVISAVGHAHIDLAWLWPLRETIRKGARTFATTLALMDRYPDYVFGASQPQLYAWMKERFPRLYDRIREKVAEGRWEIQGAMWVESDTNVPSGESLVRQILHGKRFFRSEFGVDTDCLWLPDVFGYTASLPQLLRKSGVPYFMTQKLSWSLVNTFPHHTFHWQGIDGSRVLAHMPPEDTYNSSAAPRALHKAESNYRDKTVSDSCLLLFGIGDGGGGPGEEHLERLRRERNLDGLPPVVQEPASAFFRRLSRSESDYAVWSGELYLERHQGTFTTQSRSKRYNRKLELALRELELSAVLAERTAGEPYPVEMLDRIWKEMLLLQFHDILPGSSITRVYDESLDRYAGMMAAVEERIEQADRAWLSRISSDGAARTPVVINSLSWERREWVRLADGWMEVTVPPMGYAVVDSSTERPAPSGLIATPTRLENDRIRIELDPSGEIVSIFDKENNREIVPPEEMANRLVAFDDPGDAWDFAIDYNQSPFDTAPLLSAEATIDGPRAILRQSRGLGESRIEQRIVLTAGSRRIDFITEVDWRETGRLLRAWFPVAIHADEATCEIQFGSLKRPARKNTTWEAAMFEVPAQKWVDLSERGYGVALLNDCKYGYRIGDGRLDLHLLRSPSYPDPTADRGRHEFTYSLYPHAGDAVEGMVGRAGYELNVPLRVREAERSVGSLPTRSSWLSVEAPNVIVETVKRAEDSEDVIVRLYESTGATTDTGLIFAVPPAAAYLVDLMEENPAPVPFAGNRATLRFAPFEIHTLRLKYGP